MDQQRESRKQESVLIYLIDLEWDDSQNKIKLSNDYEFINENKVILEWIHYFIRVSWKPKYLIIF